MRTPKRGRAVLLLGGLHVCALWSIREELGITLRTITDAIFSRGKQLAIDEVGQNDLPTFSSLSRHDPPGVIINSSTSETTRRFIPFENTRNAVLNAEVSTRRLPFSNLSMTFHLAHTSDESDIQSLQWHCIESIFFHHPNAKVIIHVKRMTAAPFQYLIDAGYDLQVRKYTLVDLLLRLKDTKVVPEGMVDGFLKRMPEYMAGEFWTVAETDVLRLLNLRLDGGVYLDTDMIVVKPLDTLPLNTVGYQDEKDKELNGAILRFQEPNSSHFLQACLEEILTNFQNEPWGVNGPYLLTRVYKLYSSNVTGVETVPHSYFQYYPWEQVAEKCMKAAGKRLRGRLTMIRRQSYTVHLNNHLTKTRTIESGSLCDCLYRTFCLSNVECGFIKGCKALLDKDGKETTRAKHSKRPNEGVPPVVMPLPLDAINKVSSSDAKTKGHSNKPNVQTPTNTIAAAMVVGGDEWSKSPGNYALWTYPTAPPSNMALRDGESIICVYSPCREYALSRKITHYSLNMAKLFPLSTDLSSEQATNFKRFLDDQYWYKIQYMLEFPHHVQSVAFLLLAAVKEAGWPSVCIRPLGYDTLSCRNDSIQQNEYNPTSSEPEKNSPPFLVPGLDFNSTRFGVLGYDGRVSQTGVANSGDEMQGFSGLQFLPYLTDFVDRDFGLPDTHVHHLFANAWWGFESAFPPHSSLKAAWFSIHMSASFTKTIVPRNIEYFQRYASEVGPIGARDDPTLEFLQAIDLPTYRSSCFTQMLRPSGNRYKETSSERDLIMLVDVDPRHLPPEIVARGTTFRAELDASDMFNREARLEHANQLHLLYSTKAKVVITSRIHAALPASVNGVPVIFVEQSEDLLPGGKGGRTKGISDLFHTYVPGKKSKKWSFNLDIMPPNPGVHRQDRYRASFWNYIKRRLPEWYVDTAQLFGLVPLRRLGEGVGTSSGDIHDLFHFFFPTPSESLTWRVQRALEAVFYHHPNAKVILHCRSLPVQGTRLDAFTESGYHLEIQPYNLNDLLAESRTVTKQDKADFVAVVKAQGTSEEFMHSHETDLIRLLILEKFGGVCLDTNVHVVKPFPRSLRNVLAYGQEDDRRLLNNAVMIFEKTSVFLRELIAEAMNRLSRKYDPNDREIVGRKMFNDIWEGHDKQKGQHGQSTVEILDNVAFYPYNVEDAHSCFKGSASDSPISESTYTVHLNTNASRDDEFQQGSMKGSYCDVMFHSFCLFCDEIYRLRE